jgi:hypothetical protein
MNNSAPSKGTDSQILAADGRRAWQAPRVDDLPRLTELTLQTANGEIIEGTCQVGSTCF